MECSDRKGVREEKLVITEERRCSRCNSPYEVDLFWERQYRIRMRENPLNGEEFHALCPAHKAALYGGALAYVYVTRRIDDRDVEKMGLKAVVESVFTECGSICIREERMQRERIQGRYRRGFWMEPGDEHQCARCGLRFGATYRRFISACPGCKTPFHSHLTFEEDGE
jgi:hypothetical protein